MITAHYIPPPPLSEFIKGFWYWDGYIQPHAKERLLPDGSMTMVFNLGQDRIGLLDAERPGKIQSRPAQLISGAHSTSFTVETCDMVTTLGVQFKPGGAFPFLGMPAGELAEQHISLEDVFGPAVREVRWRLLEVSAPKRKFRILEQWLLARLARPLQRHPAVEYALAQLEPTPAGTTVASVVDRVGFSQRQFIAMFTPESYLLHRTAHLNHLPLVA